MNQDLERLRSIKSFPSLVKYLRDELDWEFETEDVEDLTYEYSPAEFGFDTKSAAAIKARCRRILSMETQLITAVLVHVLWLAESRMRRGGRPASPVHSSH